jgi:hydroxyacyl-ACP dehydratase HTD2-like protein with hotdog domain
MGEQIFFEDVAVGHALPELVKRPTHTMLFRFSAVTWNAHRIHYDEPFARSEGHGGVLVQATMHGAFLFEMVTIFAGPRGRILELDYSNRGKASPGDVLTLGGIVTAVSRETGTTICEIWERDQKGATCAKGSAHVCLPSRSLSDSRGNGWEPPTPS